MYVRLVLSLKSLVFSLSLTSDSFLAQLARDEEEIKATHLVRPHNHAIRIVFPNFIITRSPPPPMRLDLPPVPRYVQF